MKFLSFDGAEERTVLNLEPGVYSVQAVLVCTAYGEIDPGLFIQLYPRGGVPFPSGQPEMSSGMDEDVLRLAVSVDTSSGAGSWLLNMHEPGELSLVCEVADLSPASIGVQVYLEVKKQ